MVIAFLKEGLPLKKVAPSTGALRPEYPCKFSGRADPSN